MIVITAVVAYGQTLARQVRDRLRRRRCVRIAAARHRLAFHRTADRRILVVPHNNINGGNLHADTVIIR